MSEVGSDTYVVMTNDANGIYVYGPYKALDDATEAKEVCDENGAALIVPLLDGNRLLRPKRRERAVNGAVVG
jgi:hypothetical protein